MTGSAILRSVISLLFLSINIIKQLLAKGIIRSLLRHLPANRSCLFDLSSLQIKFSHGPKVLHVCRLNGHGLQQCGFRFFIPVKEEKELAKIIVDI